MTKIAHLATRSFAAGPPPAVNPLTERDALQEAQLLAIRFDVAAGSAAMLFELRVALQLHDTNTGVLAVHDVRRFTWSAPERTTSRTAWTVGGSEVRAVDGLFSMELGLWPSPGARLELLAGTAAFFAGDVPGLSDVPPDYVEDDDETIRSNLASWDSPITIASVARSG